MNKEGLAFEQFPYDGDYRGVGDTHGKERDSFIKGFEKALLLFKQELATRQGQAERNGRASKDNEVYYVGRYDLCGELSDFLNSFN